MVFQPFAGWKSLQPCTPRNRIVGSTAAAAASQPKGRYFRIFAKIRYTLFFLCHNQLHTQNKCKPHARSPAIGQPHLVPVFGLKLVRYIRICLLHRAFNCFCLILSQIREATQFFSLRMCVHVQGASLRGRPTPPAMLAQEGRVHQLCQADGGP